MTTPDPDILRRSNQQRIDALRDRVIRHEDYREDTADERAESRARAEEDYRRDDDDQLDQDTDFHSGLGY